MTSSARVPYLLRGPVGVAGFGHVGLDPLLDSGLAVREAGAAADGEFRRRNFPFHAQFGEDVVGQVFGQGTEGGPFAAHQAEHDGAALLGAWLRSTPFDAVVPRYEPRLGGVVPGQRTHARERVDDLSAVHGDVREDVADQVDEIVDLAVRADGVFGHVGVDVGGSHEHAVAHGIDQNDPAVSVFEEDLPSLAGSEQARVVKDDM